VGQKGGADSDIEVEMGGLIEKFVQCWACRPFDRLFGIISVAAAAIYTEMVSLAWMLLLVFWAFYILWIVVSNLKSGEDWTYEKSLKPAFINTLIVCVLLSLGVAFPRMITRITFEPVADIAGAYAYIVMRTNPESVDQRIGYRTNTGAADEEECIPRSGSTTRRGPNGFERIYSGGRAWNWPWSRNNQQSNEEDCEPRTTETGETETVSVDDGNGFFRPQLRDKIIAIMKATYTQFQNMIKLGFALMGIALVNPIRLVGSAISSAFSNFWASLLSWSVPIATGQTSTFTAGPQLLASLPSPLSIISMTLNIFWDFVLRMMLGIYLSYTFFKLMLRYCFYFVDVIVNLAMFAFFFPFMLVFFVFGQSSAGEWVKKMGNVFSNNMKEVFNSICALAVAIITYQVIIVVIARFLAGKGAELDNIINQISSGSVMIQDLMGREPTMVTLTSFVAFVVLLDYLTDQIPVVTAGIWEAFDIKPAAPIGQRIGDAVETVVKSTVEYVGKKGAALIKPNES